MPASSSHFTILFLAKILHTKTGYDFRFLATVPDIIYNILVVGGAVVQRAERWTCDQ